MKKTIIFIMTTVYLAVSCVEENPVFRQEDGKKVTLTASMEGDLTKTDASDYGVFSWSASDSITVINAGECSKFDYIGETGTSYGEFTGVLNTVDVLDGYAVHPHDPRGYQISGSTLSFSLHEERQWTQGAAYVPMAATVTDGKRLQFRHMSGLLRVVYKVICPEATAFVLESETEAIAGNFKADLSSETPTLVSDGAEGKKVTITFSNPTYADSMAFYIPLPAGKYSKLTMYITDGVNVIEGSSKSVSNLEVSRAELLKSPSFVIPAPGIITFDNAEETEEITFQEATLTFAGEFRPNSVDMSEDVTVTFGVESGEKLVEEYNQANGTSYLLLPETSFEVSPLVFSRGKLSAESTLTLKREGLECDKEYLLPLTVKSVDNDNVVTGTLPVVKYIKVTNPYYCYRECDRSGWTIAFCSAEDRNSTYWAKNMLDNNLKTNWASYWNTANQTIIGENVDDFRYPVEGTYPGTIVYPYGRLENTTINVLYPCCDGVRHFTKTVVVIDMGEVIALHSLGVAKMAGSDGNLDLKHMNVDIEEQFTLRTASEYEAGTDAFRAAIANYDTVDEGNDWKRILEWKDIPKGTIAEGLAPLYKQIDERVIGTQTNKGRYLRFTFPESWRTANCMEIAELYGRKLVSIDGNAVEYE